MAPGAVAIYRARVNRPSLTPDEIRAAAETHRDLGPDYQPAVIESFLEKVGREIDARVDARVAAQQQMPAAPAKRAAAREPSAFVLAVVSMAFGIPLTAIVAVAGSNPVGLGGVLVIWLAIAVINVAYSLRPPRGGR
jgi:hypothetical protein